MSIFADLDVTGVLSTIDHALEDYTASADAMRWQPPRTESPVVFTWAGEGGEEFAAFGDVSIMSLEGLVPGDRVWVNDVPFSITGRSVSPECYTFTLMPEES